MKKLLYLVSLLVVVATLSFSCGGNDELKEEIKIAGTTGITPEKLVGNWDFVSLEFKGRTYYGCDEALNRDYEAIMFDLRNVTTKEFTYYSECVDYNKPINVRMPYTLSGNVFRVTESSSYDVLSVDNKTLVLRHRDDGDKGVPVGGIFTFSKN